jgi:hypothetical protein
MKKIQTDKEAMRRMDEALKRAFQMPHKPHKPDAQKSKPKLSTGKGRVRVGKARG